MQAQAAEYEAYERDRLKGWIAWTLWFFLGGFGGHRFYLGNAKIALGMLALTPISGLGWVWSLIDAFLLNETLRKQNRLRWNLIA